MWAPILLLLLVSSLHFPLASAQYGAANATEAAAYMIGPLTVAQLIGIVLGVGALAVICVLYYTFRTSPARKFERVNR